MPSQASQRPVQPSRPEDDVAIAATGKGGAAMVLRMMVGDGVRPREEGRVRPPDIQGRGVVTGLEVVNRRNRLVMPVRLLLAARMHRTS